MVSILHLDLISNGNFPLLEERVILNEFDICMADSHIF